ncbi:MAG TPA: LuxR family transcriptional regulator [Capillimicrobium sp.]|nr:LuxR family transcriptional regulator [Capillimicrobium sp.]
MLQGRQDALALVRARVEGTRRGRGFALLIHGPPGAGTSALLDAAAAVPGVRAVRLERALAPLAAALAPARDRLPEPQARALEAADAADPRARLAAGVALRTLLGEAALDGPLVVVADDLPRLDAAARDALLFAARRPPSGGVGLLLAADRPDAAPGVEALRLEPDGDRAAHALVAAATPAVRRALVTAAAMEDDLTVGWLLAALTAQGVDAAALDDAERAGALRADGERVAFGHPSVRAAVDAIAGEAERAAAHRALAATAPDAPRRAAHLAAAAGPAPDEARAAALEAAAQAARDAGGHAEAARALARAAELTVDPGHRARRELAAAEALAVEGDLDEAQARLERAAGADPVAAARLRGALAMRRGDPQRAYAALSRQAERCERAGDDAGAAALRLEAAVAPMMTGDVAEHDRAIELARAAAARAGGPVAVLAELVAAELLLARGEDAAGDAALEALMPDLTAVDPLASTEIVGMAAQSSMWIGAHARAERILAWMIAAAEASGATARLPYPLSVRADLAFRRGRWDAALDDARAAVDLAQATGQRTMLAFTLAVLARVEAWRGARQDARRHAGEALAIAIADRADGIAVHAQAALAEVELLDGRLDAAAAAGREAARLERAGGLTQLACSCWAGPLVEALAERGSHAEAAEELEELDRRSAAGGSAYGRAVVARGRVLLAPPERIDALARAALDALDGLRLPLERARTERAIGERLHAAGRRADARPHLLAAAAAFDALGAPEAAQRARAAVDVGAPDAGDVVLSAEEHRICHLVAAGATNREIAAELYVSEKTVERRLSALYRRLGVGSRVELVRVLAAQ